MTEYTPDRPIRMVELFAGIGAQASAMERLGLPFTSVVSEIDDRAYRAYCAIHGDTPNLGDITKVEHLPECDLVTYSFPCQDISMAGRQKGFTEGSGTRSALLWEVQRLLEDMNERNCLPEVLLMENVDALLNKKNLPNFQKWCNVLSEMGYTNSYQVLNAKDYGIPQNRKRVFMVSTLHMGEFVFPPKQPLELRLKDMLEDNVDESYYLSPERIAAYEQHKVKQDAKGNGFGYKPMDPLKFDSEPEQCDADGNTVTVRKGEVAHGITNKENRMISNFIVEREKEGEDSPDDVPIEVKGNLNLEGRFESACRVYGQEGVAPTLPTGGGGGIIPKIEVDSQAGIEVKGDLNIEGRLESACRVYGTEGLIPTIPARSGDMTPKIEIAGNLNNGSIQNGVVVSPDGLAPALMASAGSKGNHVRIEVDAQPKIAGSLGDGYHANNDVYDTDGVAPVQRANAHGNNTLIEVRDSEGCIVHDIKTTSMVRVHEVDTEALTELLRERKDSSGLSNKVIAEKLDRPLTEVEHWFRTDECNCIPNPDIWFQLKELLNIDTNEFDAPITEFEEHEGVYEKSQRCYDPEGVAPTVTAGNKSVKVEVQEGTEKTPMDFSKGLDGMGGQIHKEVDPKELILAGRLTDGEYEIANRVYDPNAPSPAISATGHPPLIEHSEASLVQEGDPQ